MMRTNRWWPVLAVLATFGSAGCSLALFDDPPVGDAGDTADDAADADAYADADAEVPPNCGNGVADEDEGEECDDGNDLEGDGCDNDCSFSCTTNVHCRDDETCNGAETCDTASHMCAEGIPLDNGTPCSLPDGGGGECRRGVCRSLTCGDEIIDEGEDCDDGNDNDNDRCPSTCFDADCGDGFVWNTEGGDEECDDGNGFDGDGCDTDCTWSCSEDAHCDDLELCDGAETCTDHVCETGTPLADGTPCTSSMGEGVCRDGWCEPDLCGNGTIEPPELCDDGNTAAGDGCEPDCRPTCSSDEDCRERPTDNPCTDDACTEPAANGSRLCQHVLHTRPCDDGDPCTGPDWCLDGTCSGPAIDVDGDTYGPGPDCGGDCDDGDPAIHPGAVERCNDVDDDCDGATDEDFSDLGRACYTGPDPTRDAGLCRSGTWACDSTGSGGVVCEGQVLPQPETCNGEDDNCDLRSDNGIWCPWGNVGGNVFLQDVWVDAVDPIGFAVGYDVVSAEVVIARWMPGSSPEWVEIVRASEGTRSFLGVWGFGMEDAWAAGSSALLYRWGTTGWVPETAPWAPTSVTTMDAVWGAAPDQLWVVGREGRAYRWDGTNWVLASAGSVVGVLNLVGLCGNSSSEVWAVGEAATIVRWTGTRWEAESVTMATPRHLWECWALGSAGAWAVGENGTILSRNTTTAAWVQIASPTANNLNGVWGSPETPTWIVGAGGLILQRAGSSWAGVPTGTSIDFTAIHGRGGSDPFAVAVNRYGDVYRWRP